MSEFDIIHFGVTGFTGKLVLEHLLSKKYDVKFAVREKCKKSKKL